MGPRHARNYGYYGSYNRPDLEGRGEERMDYIPERVDWIGLFHATISFAPIAVYKFREIVYYVVFKYSLSISLKSFELFVRTRVSWNLIWIIVKRSFRLNF